MASTTEEKKARLIEKAAALAAEIQDPADRPQAQSFIAEFYEHVPPVDLAGRGPRDLSGGALALWHLARRRRPGRAKIRVYNPDPTVDGWSSPHTIVEIVNDDMPFLVDSVTGAINAGDRVVRLVIHPILTVVRDADGQLLEVGGAEASGQRESWMQIAISREADPANLARLTQSLTGALADVRAAVADWQAMRQVLREVRNELSAAPPPCVPRAQLSEAQDFLRWLDDDNFTFLGYREYVFEGAAEPARPPLGVLRDPDYPVFGGLRNLSELPPDVQGFVRRRELLIVTKSNLRATVHRTAHMDAIGLRRFDAGGAVVGVRLFLGLFTSLAYSRSPRSIPLLRQKVRHVVERAGFSPISHDGKALQHILDTLPRDELFQGDEDWLYDTAIGILNLQERQRIAVCSSAATRSSGSSPASSMRRASATTQHCGSASRRCSRRPLPGGCPRSTRISTTRCWRGSSTSSARRGARFRRSTSRLWKDGWPRPGGAGRIGSKKPHRRHSAKRRRTPGCAASEHSRSATRRRTDAAQAVADLPRIEAVLAGSPLEASLHPRDDGGVLGLRLYRANEPVVLSDVLPILENLGLRVVAEEPFRIDAADGAAVWVHEFQLGGAAVMAAADSAAAPRPVRGGARRRLDGKDREATGSTVSSSPPASRPGRSRCCASTPRFCGRPEPPSARPIWRARWAVIPKSPGISSSCSRSASIPTMPAIVRLPR